MVHKKKANPESVFSTNVSASGNLLDSESHLQYHFPEHVPGAKTSPQPLQPQETRNKNAQIENASRSMTL